MWIFSTLPKNTLDEDEVLTLPNTFNDPVEPTCNTPFTVELPVVVDVVDTNVPIVSKLPTFIYFKNSIIFLGNLSTTVPQWNNPGQHGGQVIKNNIFIDGTGGYLLSYERYEKI